MTSELNLKSLRQNFYNRIDEQNMSALWNVLSDLVTPQPRSGCRAAYWSFDPIRELMLEAGGLISALEAERRVLVLENPGLRHQSRITTSLYAGVQLVLPGEVAPAHRHTQSAIRFALEGQGAHTAVEGERTSMSPGDFVITPSMTWHDHANQTKDPMFWLDVLDIPMVQFFDASFAEKLDDAQQTISRPAGDSFARFGHNLIPVNHRAKSQTSPIFSYPYAYTRDALRTLQLTNEWDPCHGLKLKYMNPVTGSYAVPTIGAFIQLLTKGLKTSKYRSTDATIYVPVEGRGRTFVGEHVFDWKPKDVIVVPSWQWVTHEAQDDAVLFSCSDRPVQEKLDLFREDRAGC
jgi:gentisate 1,2-dioxygenase